MEAIKYYVKGAFVGVVETPAALEQQEELIADLTAKVADLVADGRSEDEALGMAIASMGDLSGLVREFAAEEPASAPVIAEPVVRTVEAYTNKLQLHVVIASAGGAVALLFVLTVMALSAGELRSTAAVWDLLLGCVGLVWIAIALRRFHADPDAVTDVELGAGKRLRTAGLQWVGVCAFALVVNAVIGGEGFWAWTIWIGTAAWPASIMVEQKLLDAGKFLYPKVPAPTPAAADGTAIGASA